MIVSTTGFIALNSVDFCNNWLRITPSDKPIWTIDSFIMGWAVFQAAVTIYIWQFVPEKAQDKDEEDSEEEELTIYMSQVPGILFDVLKNRNTLLFMGFLFLTEASYVINQNMSSVYLTSELGFSKERLSFINLALGPCEMITTLLSSYLASERPFHVLYKITMFQIFANSYSLLVLCQTFPPRPEM